MNPLSSDQIEKLDSFVTERPEVRGLKGRSVKGGLFTSLAQLLRFIVGLGSTAILARLLSPSDFGLVAMTAVLNSFFIIFSNSGLSSATIQRHSLTHSQVSSLFWINSTLGLLLTLLMCAISPLIASFYGEPELILITCIMASTFLFAGLSVQHKALLTRKMRFGSLAIAELGAVGIGITTGLCLAALNTGYWPLVAIPVVTSFSHLLLIWATLRWVPGGFRKEAETLSMLKFGGDILIFDIANYFARNLDSILIGRFWGRSQLGYYDKAYSLLMLPINQINRPLASVATPTLARIQADAEKQKHYFLSLIRLISIATVPLVGIMALFSENIILLILGDKWRPTIALFQLLAVAALIRALTNPLGWILISSGNTKKYRTLGIANSLLIMMAFAIGISFGAKGVAISYSGIMLLLFIPMWIYVLSDFPIKLREVFKVILPAGASAVIAATPFLWPPLLESSAFRSLVISGSLYASLYAISLFGIFRQFNFCLNIIKEIRSR